MTKEPLPTKPRHPTAPPPVPEIPYEAIEQAVRSIQYGVVQLIIQDGHIIQIDKTEKIRLV